MTQVNIKRIYEPGSDGDGYRVLVDKLWPRGIRKENLRYELWAKDIAPSNSLRRWYHRQPERRWEEFRKKYLTELEDSAAAADFIGRIKGQKTVTLLYGSRNAVENHALVLRDFLEKRLK